MMAENARVGSMNAAPSGNLCSSCSNFDIRGALTWRSPGQILELGPFNESIDKTDCALCKIARHVVGYQDRHETHVIRIKPQLMGSLIVERMENGLYRGAGYLNSSINEERYWKTMEDSDVALQRVEFNLRISHGTMAPKACYNTFDEDLALRHTTEWLQTCVHLHKCSTTSGGTSTLPSGAFFVDVQNNNVVKGESCVSQNYFALSYVCGGYETLELTTKNQQYLAKPGALISTSLPKTYRDAMRFAKLCAVNYLWIDFLCIMHDDKGSDQRQIDAMDQIYGNALLVLVAGLGSSAKFGLFPRSVVPEKVQNLWLHLQRTTADNEFEIFLMDIMTNKYWTRSWCFQEQFLSTRKLYFGAHWLRFHCNDMNIMICHNWSGDFTVQDVSKIKHVELQEETWAMEIISKAADNQERVNSSDLFQAYSVIVQGFSERELSYPEDVERAFAGIASILRRIDGNELFAGIPSILLPHALLWTPRTTTEVPKRSSAAEYMSYSWYSCANGVTYFPLEGERVIGDSRLKTLTTSIVTEFTPVTRGNAGRGPDLYFEASVILAEHFKFDEEQLEQWSNASASEDNDNAGGLRFYCTGDGSKQYAGYVKGIAEGHEGCLDTCASADKRYLIVPLISANNVGDVPAHVEEQFTNKEYLGIVVLQIGEMSARVGVVRLQTWAFEKYSAFVECIRLQ